MPLFSGSSKTLSAVIDEIADAAGASADTEDRARARRSLNAAIAHFNTRARWDWTLTDAPITRIVGPFTVTGVSAVSGETSAACPASHGFLVDDIVSFTGLGNGTRVSATAASSIAFDLSIGSSLGDGTVVVTAAGNRDHYAVPANWKAPYQIKTLSNQQALRPIRRRFYGRSTDSEFTAGTPVGYDILPIAAKGKVKILPPPAAGDTLQMSYYRRIASATGVADGTSADIPQDCEPYLIAYAKWHFMVDKGEGRKEQAQTWYSFADAGIKAMLAEQTNNPDEDLKFIPGHVVGGFGSPDSTHNIPWDY